MTLLALSLASYLFALWKRPLLYAGLILQVVYIVLRGTELGRLPLVGPHDTIIFLSASIAAFSIPFGFLLKDRKRFFDAVMVLTSVLTVFVMVSGKHNAPLPPVLKTFWFECHVVLAFMSYALFGVAAILGYIYLSSSSPAVTDAGPEGEALNGPRRDSISEGLQYRAALMGYCLFTLSMIFGGIWAYLAWGTYWLWTPKELWTSILWTFYSLYLHARLRNWWLGRPMAYLGIAGFVITMFTYLGVSLLMKSSHSF
ncbi:MAG: cytochrome c biogenesis protein CcsA [Nitrospirae bacterium]|nr:cytochrome c biogenesis protein CcsA [Nitrospirota bacterium]